MQKALIFKFIAIGLLALLLLIPLSMIEGVIQEREYYRDKVILDISNNSVGQQKVTGLILVAPYKEKTKKEFIVYKNGKKRTVFKEHIIQHHEYFLPETLTMDGNIRTEERYRGIYKVPVYTANLKMKGHFNIPQYLDQKENLENIIWEQPYLVLGVEDTRGINSSIQLSIDDKEVPFIPGTKTSFVHEGVHAPFESQFQKEQRISFLVDLDLQGMTQLSVTPVGKLTEVNISSPWPHPSFVGRFLPKTREITEKGFKANWQTSFFASSMGQHFKQCVQNMVCGDFYGNHFGVSLHEGVDIYLQAERSVKYALLFVALTFVVFFLFEILKKLSIHAIQYGLVGVALALFYLLLISLSEHIAFEISYLIASSACVLLLGFYVSYVLHSFIRGILFGGTLTGLYGTLFMIIRSEDNSLLMGSVLLFGVLTFVMIITRRIDWYKIETHTKKQLTQKNKQTEKQKKEPSQNETQSKLSD